MEQLNCRIERNRTMEKEKVHQANSLGNRGSLSPLFGLNKVYSATWATLKNGFSSRSFDSPLSDIEVRLSCGSHHEICKKSQHNQVKRELIMQVIDPVDEDDDSFELVEIVQSSTMLLVPINLKVETEKATSMHWSFYSEPYGTKFEISYQGPFDKASQKTNTTLSVDKESLGRTYGTAIDNSLTSFTISPLSDSRSNSRIGSQSPETLISLDVHSHLKYVSGSLVPKNAGIYVFHFDNTKLSSSTKIFLKIKLVPKSIASNHASLCITDGQQQPVEPPFIL